MNRPTRSTMEINRAQLAWCAVGLIGGVGVSQLSSHPEAVAFATALALLMFAWVASASVLTWLGSRAITCELLSPLDSIHALHQCAVELRLCNVGQRWPAFFLRMYIRIGSRSRLLPAPPYVISYLAPQQRVQFDWVLTLAERGEHDLVDLRVDAAFPGSLFIRKQSFQLGEVLLVLPAIYRLQSQAIDLLAGRRHGSGQMQVSPAAMENFIGVRPYRAGDSPRNIHLITSIRSPEYPHELAVREYEDPTENDVVIVLDTAIPEESDQELMLYRHEKSLSFAAALSRLLCSRKYRIRFCWLDPDGHVHEVLVSNPIRDMAKLENALATLQPTQRAEDVQRLVNEQARLGSGTAIFITLRENTERSVHLKRSILSVTPDWQMSLVREVVGQ